MTTLTNEQLDAGDVIEVEIDGAPTSALVLLATDDAVILDACDGSTPFVVRACDLVGFRKFVPAL